MRDYSLWSEVIDELPPFGEVVEARMQKKHPYNKIGRDYFALVPCEGKALWVNTDLNPNEYGELKVTHWRYIPPDPWGKNPFIRIKKSRDGWFGVVVYFLRIEE